MCNSKNENIFKLCFHINRHIIKVSYYNFVSKSVELLDTSGGYKKPTILNIAGYVDDEWVFGEEIFDYSFMDNFFWTKDLVGDALNNKKYTINKEHFESRDVFKELLEFYKKSVLDINPKAEIEEVFIVIDDDINIKTLENIFKSVFVKATIKYKHKISCIIKTYELNKESFNKNINLITLDDREFHIYNLNILNDINIIKKYKNNDLSINRIYTIFIDKVKSICNEHGYVINDLEACKFVEENKERIFHKNVLKKSIKLYFNFVEKPFFVVINKEVIEKTFSSYIQDLKLELENIEKTTYIVHGYGFEIAFIKELIKKYIEIKKIDSYYNAVIGCAYDTKDLINLTKTNVAIGFKSGEDFITLVEENEEVKKRFIIYDYEDDIYNLNLYINKNHTIKPFKTIELTGLPKRDKGTLRLDVYGNIKDNRLNITFQDSGFGEFYEKTMYEEKFSIILES